MSDAFQIDIDGLDDLLGGGFPRGETVLIQQSAEGLVDELVMNVGISIIDEQLTMVLLPRKSLSQSTMVEYVTRLGVSLESLLDGNKLFVLDTAGTWGNRPNVFPVETDGDVREATQAALSRSQSRGTVHVIDITALYETVGAQTTRDLFDWYAELLRGRRDILFGILRSGGVSEDVLAACRTQASQILDVAVVDDQRTLTVERASDGREGVTRNLRYHKNPPFVSLE